jgi:hypothetical protein
MKKFLAFIICAVLICASTVVVFAEGDSPDVILPDDVVEENVPTTEEEAVESEISGAEAIPDEPTAEETTPLPDTSEEVPLTGPEEIVEYIKTYFEEISVIVSLICMAFYQARKHKLLNRSVGTLNNNAITVAENSDRTMQAALANVQTMSAVVEAYKNEMADMLAEIRQNTDEKKKLEDALAEVHEHLKQSKLANIEFSNELAELLVLANIPNSKKDELYARHRAAVDAISTAENITASEVNTNDN